MNIGERIKTRRLELNLSVDEVAEKLGKNRATIYRYENNEIENFPTTVLEPLAKVLNTTPAYLMGWETSFEKNKKLIILENLLELCNYRFDEYIKCNENPNCYLNDSQKASIDYYYDLLDCCSECEYQKEYIRIDTGTNFYKLENIDFICNNILNYSKFLISEQLNDNNKLSKEENAKILPNIIYSNYNDKKNNKDKKLKALGFLRPKK